MRPLVVDMDGTLIGHDVTVALAFAATGTWPHRLFRLLRLWYTQGGGTAKDSLVSSVTLSPERLTYHAGVVALCQQARAEGRTVVLATASPQVLAQRVADYVGCFDLVLGSDATVNLKSGAKAQALVYRYGPQGFDYAGNSMQDLAVWKQAHTAYLVHPDFGVQGALLHTHDTIVPVRMDPSLMESLRRRVFMALAVAIMAFLWVLFGPDRTLGPFWPVAIFGFCLGVMLLKDIPDQQAMMKNQSPPLLIYSPKIQALFGGMMVVGSLLALMVMPFLV
ncbi:MAG: haloacid dehalogenase-like hydrolase [Alphaproteobacteria bacterium]